jgi:6-phosphogluconolactonase
MKNTKIIYVASYREDGGIYRFRMDEGGRLERCGFTPISYPSYMAYDGGKLYVAIRKAFTTGESGIVSFDVSVDGELTNPTEPISTMGVGACHLFADKGEIFAANYNSGSVIKLPASLSVHAGRGIDPERQEAPHTHCVCPTPDGKFVAVCDLGLDKVLLYDRNMKIHSEARVPEGHGPRHIAFSENGKYAFVANELKSTVSAFEYDGDGLRLISTVSALPEGYGEVSYAAAIRVSGDEIYVSNRGHDSISVLGFKDGALELRQTISSHGEWPRDFILCGGYFISANEHGNSVAVISEGGELVCKEKIETPLAVLAI